MDENKIIEIKNKYCREEFDIEIKKSLSKNLINYLNYLNFKKLKISNKEKLEINYKLKKLKSEIEYKINLLKF